MVLIHTVSCLMMLYSDKKYSQQKKRLIVLHMHTDCFCVCLFFGWRDDNVYDGKIYIIIRKDSLTISLVYDKGNSSGNSYNMLYMLFF